MADVFDDDPLSSEDALAYEEMLLKAEIEHRNRGTAIEATTSIDQAPGTLLPPDPGDAPQEAFAGAVLLEPKVYLSKEKRLEVMLASTPGVCMPELLHEVHAVFTCCLSRYTGTTYLVHQ